MAELMHIAVVTEALRTEEGRGLLRRYAPPTPARSLVAEISREEARGRAGLAMGLSLWLRREGLRETQVADTQIARALGVTIAEARQARADLEILPELREAAR